MEVVADESDPDGRVRLEDLSIENKDECVDECVGECVRRVSAGEYR